MTVWFEHLERLRKEQRPNHCRPQIQLEIPAPRQEEQPKEKPSVERGVVVIDDETDNEGVIIISI